MVLTCQKKFLGGCVGNFLTFTPLVLQQYTVAITLLSIKDELLIAVVAQTGLA